MLKKLILFFSVISGPVCLAASGISNIDPYIVKGTSGMASGLPGPYTYNYNGRTQVAPSLPGCSNIGVGVFIGTSNTDNYVNATYSPANPTKIFNLSIDNGGIYQSQEPLLGGYLNTSNQPTTPTANGNFIHQLSDKLITAGTYGCFVNVPLGVTSSVIADWTNPINDRITVAFKRIAAIGLTVNFVVLQEGENDTTAGTSQVSYAASQTSVISTIRNSFAGTILISTTSYIGGVTSSNVTNAQAAAINHGANIWAGPNTDSLDSSNRWDNTHWNATGAAALSALYVTQIGLAPH